MDFTEDPSNPPIAYSVPPTTATARSARGVGMGARTAQVSGKPLQANRVPPGPEITVGGSMLVGWSPAAFATTGVIVSSTVRAASVAVPVFATVIA